MSELAPMTVVGKEYPRVDGPLKVTGTAAVRLRP